MSEPQDWSKSLLAVAAGLVVGVLAAVGVVGDQLSRMVRNHPLWSAFPLGVLLVFGGLIAASQASKVRTHKKITRVIAVGVPLVLIVELGIGAFSQTTRENPGIRIWFEGTGVDVFVHASATGSGLRSDERMLLQVLAITSVDGVDITGENPAALLEPTCRKPYNDPHNPPPKGVEVLSWAITGPDTNGVAETEMASPLRAGARVYCAYAASRNRSGIWVDQTYQNSWALLTHVG